MAYFSNLREYSAFQARNCETCVHDPEDCPVIALHEIWNPDQCVCEAKEAGACDCGNGAFLRRRALELFVPAWDGECRSRVAPARAEGGPR